MRLPEPGNFDSSEDQRVIFAHAYMVGRWLASSTLDDLEHELDELSGSEGTSAREAERIIREWIRVRPRTEER